MRKSLLTPAPDCVVSLILGKEVIAEIKMILIIIRERWKSERLHYQWLHLVFYVVEIREPFRLNAAETLLRVSETQGCDIF